MFVSKERANIARIHLALDLKVAGDTLKWGRESMPLASAEVEVLEAGQVTSRITATRILALGVFALAAKKKTYQDMIVQVKGDGQVWVIKVDRKDAEKAYEALAILEQLIAV